MLCYFQNIMKKSKIYNEKQIIILILFILICVGFLGIIIWANKKTQIYTSKAAENSENLPQDSFILEGNDIYGSFIVNHFKESLNYNLGIYTPIDGERTGKTREGYMMNWDENQNLYSVRIFNPIINKWEKFMDKKKQREAAFGASKMLGKLIKGNHNGQLLDIRKKEWVVLTKVEAINLIYKLRHVLSNIYLLDVEPQDKKPETLGNIKN